MEVQQLGTESIPPLGALATNNGAKYLLNLYTYSLNYTYFGSWKKVL